MHNADGTLATVNSEGYTWHVFDFSTTLGSYAWVMTIADTVATPDEYGNAMFDGVFIDGYRGPGGWANQLIPKANATTQSAWIAGVNRTGPLLEEALGAGTIRLQNPYEPSFPGYNSFSIEFFDWSVDSIKNLIYAGTAGFKMAEIHTYAGADVGKFNLTLAAYLVGVWPGAYFGAGSQWSQCDDWLLPHTEYERPLGEPVGPATFNDGVWTRSFNGGATKVVLNSTAGTSCISWGDGYTTGNNC